MTWAGVGPSGSLWTLNIGGGDTKISASCSGMEARNSCTGPIIAWANGSSSGVSFDLIPVSKLSNNGLVIPDLSYHSASIVVDFEEGVRDI